MQININIHKLISLSLTFAAAAFVSMQAQTYHLPGQHNQQSADLLAKQEHVNDQINLSVNNYLNYAEEEEPELDIYTEGWDSKTINCYSPADVPQTAIIDVASFSMPHPGYITSPYGYRKRFRRQHKGIDLKVNIGDTIRAAFDGKVRITNFERRGYGNYVVLRHTNSLETVYGHLSKFLVEPDQVVKAGDPIALGGNTGRSTGPHLHFETRYMGYAINPAAIFDFPNQTVHTDTYVFDKATYDKARNYDAAANAQYAQAYRQAHPVVYNNSSSSKSAGATTSKYYTVKQGDSLSKIASRNHTTVATICRLNGIKTSATIRPGQKLRLR